MKVDDWVETVDGVGRVAMVVDDLITVRLTNRFGYYPPDQVHYYHGPLVPVFRTLQQERDRQGYRDAVKRDFMTEYKQSVEEALCGY